MEIDIIAYGIAKDILGGGTMHLEVDDNATVNQLLIKLRQQYPELNKLKSLAVALNEDYANGDEAIKPNDEIVLIPPVSGG